MFLLDESIRADLFRYAGAVSYKLFFKFLFVPGFRFTFFLRKCNKHGKKSFKGVLYRLLYRRYLFKYGIQIYPSTQIGHGFYMAHFGNIVVNPQAKIGSNCNVAQGVTIGQSNRGAKKGSPTIGNCVWIGPNSVVVGNIVIGDNVLIGGGAMVNIDIPSNSIVIGNPCTVIPKMGAIDGYITNKYFAKD